MEAEEPYDLVVYIADDLTTADYSSIRTLKVCRRLSPCRTRTSNFGWLSAR
jgi:hypothetical protein